MIWIHYVLIAGSLALIAVPATRTPTQAQNRPTPARVATSPPAAKTGLAALEGSVLDAKTRIPVAGAVVRIKNAAGVVKTQQTVNADGLFTLTLDPRQPYVMTTTAPGYEPHDKPLNYTSSHAERLQLQPIELYRTGTKPPQHQNATSIESNPPAVTAAPTSATSAVAITTPPVATVQASAGQASAGVAPTPPAPRLTPPKTLDAKVVYAPPLVVSPTGTATQMRAIQFVQSKAELLPNAQPALEQLATFLKDNPTTEIELGGHTDNQGDFDENIRLSKERVDVVKAYLVANGIAASRITTRGYGPTRSIGSNNAESTRQLNRRVEMTVLKQ